MLRGHGTARVSLGTAAPSQAPAGAKGAVTVLEKREKPETRPSEAPSEGRRLEPNTSDAEMHAPGSVGTTDKTDDK